MLAETVISFSPSYDSAWTDIGEINAQRIALKATQGLIPFRSAGRVLSPSLRIPMGSIPTDRLLDIVVPRREGVPGKKEPSQAREAFEGCQSNQKIRDTFSRDRCPYIVALQAIPPGVKINKGLRPGA